MLHRGQGHGDACKLAFVGADRVWEGSLSTPTHIWILPAQVTIRQAPSLPFLPRTALQSLFSRRGSHRSAFHATTHFSQLLHLPGAPAFQDTDLSVGCRVVRGKTSHSGTPAPIPILSPHSHLLNPSHLGLTHATTTANKADEFSALVELMFWLERKREN